MAIWRPVVVLLASFFSYALLAQTATVSRNLVLRKEPSKTATALRSLEKYEEIEILDLTPKNEYLHVETEDDLDGWVLAKYVHTVPNAGEQDVAAALEKTKEATALSASAPKPQPHSVDFILDGKTCGPDGSGDKRDKGTNLRKNRIDIPTSYADIQWSVIATLPLPKPVSKSLPKSRENFTADQLGEIEKIEGQAVRTVGYIVANKPQASNAESCNCGWKGEKATDWHIALVENVGDGEKTSVVVEPTPRIKINHPKWKPSVLKPWVNSDRPVRISGWLLFDPSHNNHMGKYRNTLWEIHPITKIEVWARTPRYGRTSTTCRINDENGRGLGSRSTAAKRQRTSTIHR